MSTVHPTSTAAFTLQRSGAMEQYRAQRAGTELEDGPTTDSDPSVRGESDYEDEDEEEDVEDSVREDMKRLEDTFPGISDRFRLVNRIGEGTFSTVYKAEDLQYDDFINDWDTFQDKQSDRWSSPPAKRRRVESEGSKRRKPRYVALKKIYVTSSPLRIQNELELLHDLRGCRSVCPLITAFRHQDQVVAVLPFFPHTDFRIQYRTFMVADMRHYFRSLFTALNSVHKHDILHRDIKPTNFLYNPELREGVLVDFGLAEREGSDYTGTCLCANPTFVRRSRFLQSYYYTHCSTTTLSNGYPKNDSRPARRANRAGTRGFRAPEVLFKCTSQTTKIDMWSAGVILLTLLGRRFPFFNSADDVDAMIEMASIFGTRRMKTAAAMHGQIFETNIPTIGEKGYGWEKLVKWASCVEELTESERQATRLLAGLMELDPYRRLSAREALTHEFFTNPIEHDVEWGGHPEDSGDTGEDDEGDKEDDEADEVAMV
ncbi:serine/threonine protein kinase CDC7 [Aspergillus clavatus NRRL 1]|uniref:non-specific serine/threonine protein kinase n=1 Tax=Aspergillus clavatus (strain ATCC 1007 / CBS 513.65 / DSM 816 / NCTC 3887 / NRRL 1 / QM 1276 / 107) TaxID=344612 RepID=A1CJ28_ASPCL|nr:cell cycle protein kinase, putative [Aspergillus clavatus NRRL 1]EAW09152.1 cell cycle protein kinase, putative [Aspergillus clavatus NRRL 1]